METRRIRLFGIVQGVGFRPFAAVTAADCGICGTVANRGSYVEIFAQGGVAQLDRFTERLSAEAPPRAMILDVRSEICENGNNVFSAFSIIESEHEAGDIFVSPDIAVCDECRAELFDPQDRRYLHPFINCTQCGPRLTILDTMPYDRERTSMRAFPMCDSCAEEYHSSSTRRYDAQPVCCNDCGPTVSLLGTPLRGGEAITAVRRMIADGKIVAVKGIGGFHLCCDARNAAAVELLRQRKQRPMKPFAVMLKSIETAERECVISEGQRAYLAGWQKPILLLEKREGGSLCAHIAPDHLTVGVMLPYTPLHCLLFDYPDGVEMTDCLVMTSGNARGAPICRDDASALRELSGFCDGILTHDRDILIRADDSVCDWLDGAPYMIRRSRGFAPLPIAVRAAKGEVLGIGGELKNSFCVAKNGLLYASPYVGDMADLRTVEALHETVHRLCGLLEAKPSCIVCDTHPMYNTVTAAEELAAEWGVPLLRVQHHYAHILSCMAENDVTERVIGVSFDGTGYGDDGSIWGGELLLCGLDGYERVGSIAPFMQAGGDASSREGWRIAASLLKDAFGADAASCCERLGVCSAGEYRVLSAMTDMGVNSVRSTSCGRVFDAAAAILGIRRASTFEGEAATALMYEAERAKQCGLKRIPLSADISAEQGFLTLGTTALIVALTERYLAAQTPEIRAVLSLSFHEALADTVLRACEHLRGQSGISVAALSGGVFQNRLLTALCKEKLTAAGFTVLLHRLIPPNDGGICIGQALYGASRI